MKTTQDKDGSGDTIPLGLLIFHIQALWVWRKKMENRCYFGRTGVLFTWPGWLITIVAAVLVLLSASPGMALKEMALFEKPFRISGFINQNVGYGIGGDHFDNKEDWQSFRYDVLLETKYNPHRDLDIFISGMLTGDWAYDLLSDDSEWKSKGFNESRDTFGVDTDLRDLLQEAHVTWTPGNFLFRFGKQIVVWGETDNFRLMDQINPQDQSRGMTDFEFETSIVPIWLARMEYFVQPDSTWLQDLGFEFIFNPNADFVANDGPGLGSDAHGVWGVGVDGPPLALDPNFGPIPYPIYLGMSAVPVPGLTLGLPSTASSMGSIDADIKEPDDWDSDYFEFGIRVKALINDAVITLNYFYGRDKSPITKFTNPATAPFSGLDISPYDGRAILHMDMDGYFPRFRLTGFTFTRDFETLNLSALGGVAPVLRLEAFYAFDNTFAANIGGMPSAFEAHDEIRYAIGIDWKIKVNWLNPRAYFTIMPQFYHRYIADYPSSYTLTSTQGSVEDNNYMFSLVLTTSYFHNKLVPTIVMVQDTTNRADLYQPQVAYEYSDKWNFTMGAVFLNGRRVGYGFQPLDNKDHVFFTASYRF
jgi:Protein of unknown function (DUF1302)